MNFSSFEFLIFFPLVALFAALAPDHRTQKRGLLVASYIFYGWWDWRFTALLLFSSCVDFVAGAQIAKRPDGPKRKGWLTLSLCANLGVLAYFKYANFFLDSIQPALSGLGITITYLEIVLPVGISFFTFQTMSYTIDIYRKVLKPTRSFWDFALFVSFFPQLVAGPIVRATEFLPQLAEPRTKTRYRDFRIGTTIFAIGFVKKVLFADNLGFFADRVFEAPELFSSAVCWVGLFAYGGQIYYDFSGYSEMAIGAARVLGFELPQNFRTPYLSRSFQEFWRRWHITLSSWLRDYLYISLGGNHGSRRRTAINLGLTMALGGLWHGASINFVLWGLAHGLFLSVERLPVLKKLRHGVLGWLTTYLLVHLAWVLFRAPTLGEAAAYYERLFVWSSGFDWYYVHAVVALMVGATFHILEVWRKRPIVADQIRGPLAASLLVVAIVACILLAPQGTKPFIYFQF